MAIDATGQVYHDLVTPNTPATPVPAVARTIDALAQATPEQQRAFLRDRKTTMDPKTYATAVATLYKASKIAESGPARAMRVGPTGIPEAAATRPYGGPARPDDPAYLQILASSGVRYPSQRFINDPRR